MAEHLAEYPWSSYRYNALGEQDALVVAHREYGRLGKTPEQRQTAYQVLFRRHISEKSLDEIRKATNKPWVLGSSCFKDKIAAQLNRPVSPSRHGGDRKSVAYKEKHGINRVCPY